MMKQTFFSIGILVASISVGTAGTIVNGVWSPVGCGTEPIPPAVVTTSVEAFNQSVKVIKDWQQKNSTYNSCLIDEANKDNILISKIANEEQARFQAALEKIKADAAAATAKLSATPAGK